MTSGEPDLRVYLPGGKLVLIELKTSKGSLSNNQKKRHKKLKDLGFDVFVAKAKTPNEMVNIIREIMKECTP